MLVEAPDLQILNCIVSVGLYWTWFCVSWIINERNNHHGSRLERFGRYEGMRILEQNTSTKVGLEVQHCCARCMQAEPGRGVCCPDLYRFRSSTVKQILKQTLKAALGGALGMHSPNSFVGKSQCRRQLI
jgi:hypothetical protein